MMQGLTRTQLLHYSKTDCTWRNVNGIQQPVTTMLSFIHLGFKLIMSDSMPVCNLPNPCTFWNMFNVWDSETCETGKPSSLPTATFNLTTKNLSIYTWLRIIRSWQPCKNTSTKNMQCHTAILQVCNAFFYFTIPECGWHQNVFFISSNAKCDVKFFNSKIFSGIQLWKGFSFWRETFQHTENLFHLNIAGITAVTCQESFRSFIWVHFQVQSFVSFAKRRQQYSQTAPYVKFCKNSSLKY